MRDKFQFLIPTAIVVAALTGCGDPALPLQPGQRSQSETSSDPDRSHDREDFVPNSQCTIGNTWDPDVDGPDHDALHQLAPDGKLRVGVFTGNGSIAQRNSTTGLLSGPAIDVACRMAARLELPLEFVDDASRPGFLALFQAGAFEIAFSVDPTLAAKDEAVAHPYVGVENTYLVPIGSPFLSVGDVDRPGVRIAVPLGASPDLYLSIHLRFATLVRALSTTGDQNIAAFNLLKAGKVDAVATGRAAELRFIDSSWPGQGRVLPDDIFVAELGPFMHLNNPDGVCWLSAYIEGAKASGLLAQAIARSNTTIGRTVPPPLPGCSERIGDKDSDRIDPED